ncbi:hypothetical protein J2X04_001689 [Lysobacter niabensis]|uniref:Exo-alpha-sialidase n=1 Tax=Agrilutibacter niabensis TaxID=380628 RepID=A0ABU1VPC2_9GAMM|nr:hypothetical protein [Lysobacter niabensis]MDR7099342.1 hypothetical protein [Lysobacter niabensis]
MNIFRWALAAVLAFAVFPAWAGLQKAERPGAGEGLVYFDFAVNFPRTTNGQGSASVIAVEREDGTGPAYYLDGSEQGFQSTFAYAGNLPVGRYRFRDFQSTVCYVMCGRPSTPPPEDMPTFEVREGSVAYLGTILYSQTVTFEGKKREDHKEWGWRDRPDPTSGAALVARSHSALDGLPVTVGWTGESAGAVDRMNRIRLESAAMILSGRNGDEGFWFGSLNGVVQRWRPGEPGITVFDTGTDFMMNTVAESDDGSLVAAAGEGGTLRFSSDTGRTWQDGAAGLPFGVVSNLVPLKGKEFALTVALKEEVAVFRGVPGDAWHELARFPMKFALWTGMPGVQPQAFHVGDSLVLTLPSRKFAVVNLIDGRAEVRDPPGSIGAFKASPDGALWCTCAKTLAFSPYVSRDLGRTWEAASFSRFMVLPEFADAQKGFSYQGALFNAKSTGLSLTQDGGKTWTTQPLPDADLAWWQPAYSKNGQVMLLHSLQVFGGVGLQLTRYSTDGGQTWSYIPRRVRWAHAPVASS